VLRVIPFQFHKTTVGRRKAQSPTGTEHSGPFVEGLGWSVQVLQNFSSENEVKDLISKRKILGGCADRNGAAQTDVHSGGIGEA